MTALAKLPEKWRRTAKIDALQVERIDPAILVNRMLACADELTAALSPAELGGVEKEKPAATVSVVMGRMGEIAPHCVILSNEYEAWLDNQPFGTVHRLYTNPRAAEAEWLPIESAPTDGTEILVYVPPSTYTKGYVRSVQWREHDIDFWHVEDNKHGPFPLRGGSPTHWRPLPAPPALTPPSAKGENK